MKKICLYFQVHQPYRLKTFRFFDIGSQNSYWDAEKNRSIMKKVAEKCYLPTNRVLMEIINEFGSDFKVSFSISGVALDQFKEYAPEVMDSFKELAASGSVEFLSETYSHSLSALVSKSEFKSQIKSHAQMIYENFNQIPRVFRNTELIYSNQIGKMIHEFGFKGILAEGANHVLDWKSPNYLYTCTEAPELKLLLKNFRLSDDIAFRFSDRNWTSWPLNVEKYKSWLNSLPDKDEIVNLFMDYETFGEHQWKETGIFNFLRHLPKALIDQGSFQFVTPGEAIGLLQPVGSIDMSNPVSWADEERDLSAWLGNDIQNDAFESLYLLESKMSRVNDPLIIQDWKRLQTSDHFYYMCTKFFSDGDVHKYFNPYHSPFEAFINYMNVLSDFEERIEGHLAELSMGKKTKTIRRRRTFMAKVG